MLMRLKSHPRAEKLFQRPERLLSLGFFLLILVGTALLSLPIAANDGRGIGLFNGFFTATSAVCVTGLVAA